MKIALYLLTIFTPLLCCGKSWTPVANLDSSKEWLSQPTARIDAKGNAVVAWQTETQGIFASRFDSKSQQWQTSVVISLPHSKCGNPNMSMDRAGNALAIWGGDNFAAAYYDALSNQWSPPLVLGKCGGSALPHVSFFPNGNAMAVWLNEATQSIQTVYFDKALQKWTDPISVFTNVVTSGFHNFCFKMDQAGNGCVIWTENGVNKPLLKGGFYNYETRIWSAAMDVAEASMFNGINLFYKSNGNAVIIWGELLDLTNAVLGNEYEAKTLNMLKNRAILSLGGFPRVDAKASEFMGLSSIMGPQFTGGAAILDEDLELQLSDLLVWQEFAVFHDIGLDDRGNAIVAWNERGAMTVEKIAHYNADKKAWKIVKEFSESEEGLGITKVDMHSKGPAVIVWDSFDEQAGNHVIKAVVYRPKSKAHKRKS